MTFKRELPIGIDEEWEQELQQLQHDQRVKLAELEALSNLFLEEGWKILSERAVQEEAASFAALASMNTTGDQIPYYRARANFLGWLRGLPEQVRIERDTLAADLSATEAPKEE